MHSHTIIFVSLFIALIFSGCTQNSPTESIKPCISDKPAEDTTRVYFTPKKENRDTLLIVPNQVYTRFYTWVKNIRLIRRTVEKYGLEISEIYYFDNQFVIFSEVPTGKRAEYYFTPYGKEGYCNFGVDSLVEYSFGIFRRRDLRRALPSGIIRFMFIDGTSQRQIDSLFNVSGLRFLYTWDDARSGKWYYTIITQKARKNVLDLGYDLQFVPFAQDVVIEEHRYK